MTNGRPLTIESGRILQARARMYQRVEKVGLVMSGVAIPLFAFSYMELRHIDDVAEAGGLRAIPYFAYLAILLFVAGFVVIKVTRHLVADISRALEAEEKRRMLAGEDHRPG